MRRILALLIALSASLAAQPMGTADKLTVTSLLSADAVPPGGSIRLAVVADIHDPWHINAHKTTYDYLIGTKLELESKEGIIVADMRYPKGKALKFDFAEKPIDVYERRAVIFVDLKVSNRFTPGVDTLRGMLTVQACNNEVCLAPSRIPVVVPLTIAEGADGVARHEEVFGLRSSDAYERSKGEQSELATLFETEGSIVAFFAIFLIGLALNLTPCVYPMLSVTVSLFGTADHQHVRGAFFKAVVYVLGIATMYTVLGVSAALSGGLFGSWLQSPWVLGGIGALLFGLALSSFGLYQLQMPYWVTSRLGGQTGTGLIGLYLSGLVVGVFAAPCIGPPVIALLALVGAKGDPMFGFQAFFSLSMGLGFPYLILGTFSGLIKKIPRSGVWMVWVERVFGVILVGAAMFYLALAFLPKYSVYVVPVTLVLGGLYLGFLDPSGRGKKTLQRVQWAVGIVAIVAGALVARSMSKDSIEWEPYHPQRVVEARENGMPVIMDFSADWCIPCKEMELNTFTDPEVIKTTRDMVRLKVDLTQFDSPESEALRREYRISGVPTIVFFDAEGSEAPDSRLVGFVPPAEFLAKTRRVLGGN
ncbi:MAG: thioredoxin fold domain-containing protein [Bacteroidetes bacterium]|jgi:thiol:disulfide interchange protein DsbD|nr:thioredoxin fold domain-containing protein [Bacteroidota bacterium]